MNKTVIENIIFDLDGVLVDACEWHYESLNKALIKNCFEAITLSNHKKTFNGLPTKVKLKMIGLNNKEIEKVFFDKQDLTNKVIHDLCVHDTAKMDFLFSLKNKGIKIGCVTNSIRKTSMAMLSNSGIIDFIDTIISNEDVSEPKPNQEGYLKCMRLFLAKPSNTIIVEDSENGIAAASKTGCSVWIVKNSTSVNEEGLDLFCTMSDLILKNG